MWVETLRLQDVRNIDSLEIDLSPGLNLFFGDNAQGKTSILEAVGLLARGRSFRSDDARCMIRRGTPGLVAKAVARAAERRTELSVALTDRERRFQLNGKPVPAREYRGRLEVAVYSGERLRVVRGSMRDRRAFLDRGGAALWPAYQQSQGAFERVLAQRNAALQRRTADLASWDERYAELATDLRARRHEYARRLNASLRAGFRPSGERYEVGCEPPETEPPARLVALLRSRRREETAAGRSLVGPHRDAVRLTIEGREAAEASSGQARSLLLALTIAALDVYREERGAPAIALLDDLDSELDERRGRDVCERFRERGQALVTTAHPAWAGSLRCARRFAVESGRVLRAD